MIEAMRARTILSCSLVATLVCGGPLGVAAQPPPGTGGSPPVAPAPGSGPSVVVPEAYGGGGAPPVPGGTPYGASPFGPSPYGTSPYPAPSGAYGVQPYPPATAVPYGTMPYSGSVYTNYNLDPSLYAEYERLPRRGPYVALIAFGSLAILMGLPTLVQELRYGDPRNGGAVAFGAISTGLGALAIGISAYKLHVRNAGIRRLRAQGLMVSFRVTPTRGGTAIGAQLSF